MDIFNAAQHALCRSLSSVFILLRYSPFNLLRLINQEERGKIGKFDVAVVKKIVIWFSFSNFVHSAEWSKARERRNERKLDDS